MPEKSSDTSTPVNILWFRHGLRIHDNKSLEKAVGDKSLPILPLYIFDGETTVSKMCGYNKMAFLVECLEDLDQSFKKFGGKLICVKGKPTEVLANLKKRLTISSLIFDQDCEPIWKERDDKVKKWCEINDVNVEETIGATLWDPLEIIETNGGSPPITYKQFVHVTKAVGEPPKPIPDIDLTDVEFAEIEENLLVKLHGFPTVPTPETLGYTKPEGIHQKVFKGGETKALEYFHDRMRRERASFEEGSFLPNRRNPDIYFPTKSLSPDLKFGCISVRLFYWSVMETFRDVHDGTRNPSDALVQQLIWREFFYAMSAENPYYGEMERNPICINIPWYKDQKALEKFKAGQTGYPFVDAGIQQMKVEGWVHHVIRNCLSMFLTRGDLWLNWEEGFKIFMTYLIDADFAVCAGNWMWVSSSAFEKALNSNFSLDPGTYGRRVDPYGKYIKKFIPKLKNYPVEYVYEPWTAPIEIQEEAGCIIGKDYPNPMINHNVAFRRNAREMNNLAKSLLEKFREEPIHVKPSNAEEAKRFLGLNDEDCPRSLNDARE